VEWIDHRRPGALTISERAAMVVVESVGSCRASLRRWYDATVRVDAPEHVARRRVLARGTDSDQFVDDWTAQEDAVMERERPWAYADVVVSGTDGGLASSGTLITVLAAAGPHTERRSRPHGSTKGTGR
jgi:dephospho-CoA kinase